MQNNKLIKLLTDKLKEKGYTLIELLAIILLILIILSITTYSIVSYIKDSKEKIKNIEVSAIISAAKSYYSEMQNTNNYQSYTDENNIKYSCISVKSLINMGYYKGDISFLNEKLTKENTIIKVKDINKVPSFELITNYTKDKDCIYYDYTTNLDDDTEIKLNNQDENNSIQLDTKITKQNNNNYILKLKFTADIYEKIEKYTIPLYVLEVLDTSSSMNGTKYTNALNASLELSNNLIDKFQDSYIGLINFSTEATLKRTFSHDKLTKSNFSSASGTTNILHALDLAYEEMNKVKPNEDNIEPIKYIIFLSDGLPVASYRKDSRCNSYTTNCDTALEEYSSKIKQDLNTYFVVIGYNMNNDIYKKIASQDTKGTICPDSDYIENNTKYCYYNSDSSNINNLFNSITNSIEQTVKSQSLSKSTINIEFNKEIILYDNEGNKINNLNIDIDFNNKTEDILNKEYTYQITIDKTNEDNYTCDYEKKECTYVIDLFKKYNIDLYDLDQNPINKIEIEKTPTITVTKKLKSYIN